MSRKGRTIHRSDAVDDNLVRVEIAFLGHVSKGLLGRQRHVEVDRERNRPSPDPRLQGVTADHQLDLALTEPGLREPELLVRAIIPCGSRRKEKRFSTQFSAAKKRVGASGQDLQKRQVPTPRDGISPASHLTSDSFRQKTTAERSSPSHHQLRAASFANPSLPTYAKSTTEEKRHPLVNT